MLPMNAEEQFVRNANKNGVFFITNHANEKMGRLKIELDSVIKCLEEGILVETQSGYEGESPRMLFYNGHSFPFYIVVAIELPNVVTITVCETDLSQWEICGESIKRK